MPTTTGHSPSLTMFNLAHEHGPDRVVSPAGAGAVAEIVRAAAAAGDRVHVVGAGHGWAEPIDGGVALLTGGLAGVEVDPTARTARVGAGTRWGEVVTAAAAYGLAPVCGSSPGVGVVGYLLGGGLSPIGRSYGWGSDFVRSFELVTGTGERVVADASRHPELFWALRGGKHAPGVVTAVVIGLVPLATLYAGGLFFAAEDAGTVLPAFAAWSAQVPDAVNTSCALLRLPDLPTLPGPLRGRFVVHVRVAVVGPADAAAELLAPLRAVATPVVDTVAELPFGAIGAVHLDPEEPMPALEAGALLRDFDAAAAQALLEVAGPDAAVPLAVVELRRLGGQLAGSPAVPDAVVGRDAGYGLFVISAPVPELFDGPVPAAVRAVARAMAPWAAGTFQPNFVGSLNAPDALDRAWPEDTRERLAAVRRAYDPASLFGRSVG